MATIDDAKTAFDAYHEQVTAKIAALEAEAAAATPASVDAQPLVDDIAAAQNELSPDVPVPVTGYTGPERRVAAGPRRVGPADLRVSAGVSPTGTERRVATAPRREGPADRRAAAATAGAEAPAVDTSVAWNA